MLCFMKIPIVEMHLQLCFIVWVRLSMGIQGNCQLSDRFACAVVLGVSLQLFHFCHFIAATVRIEIDTVAAE